MITGAYAKEDFVYRIVINIRLARTITGVCVGMNLVVAGAPLQGILRNPMASPNIIGVNAGAGFAAVLIMTVIPGKITAIPIAVFGGWAAMIIYSFSLAARRQDHLHCLSRYCRIEFN